MRVPLSFRLFPIPLYKQGRISRTLIPLSHSPFGKQSPSICYIPFALPNSLEEIRTMLVPVVSVPPISFIPALLYSTSTSLLRGKSSPLHRVPLSVCAMTDDNDCVEHPQHTFHLDSRGKEVFNDRNWDSVSSFYSRLPSLSSLTLDSISKPEALDPIAPHEGATCPLSDDDEAEICKKLLGTETANSGAARKSNLGKWDRATWQIQVAYNGAAFAGWQRQNDLHTVQGVLESALAPFGASKNMATCPVQLTVAGRTDKGVHAANQICSFRTWKRELDPALIIAAINSAAPQNIIALSTKEVPRSFHPVFSACWRRYIYLLPLNQGEGGTEGVIRTEPSNKFSFCHQSSISVNPDSNILPESLPTTSDPDPEIGPQRQARNVSHNLDPATQPHASMRIRSRDDASLVPPPASASPRGDGGGNEDGDRDGERGWDESGDGNGDGDGDRVGAGGMGDGDGDGAGGGGSKWCGINVARVDALLRSLVNHPMCFTAVARDTKAGRSSGAATVCHLYRAQACIALLPNHDSGSEGGERQRVMCVELIANRFLRRMVRVLVSTAIREAGAGGSAGALEKLLITGERRATAPPMPPQGLCFADVGFSLHLPPPLVGR